jgi:hypothetical protein
MNKLLEESERRLFRSAVSVAESTMLIERSRKLICHKRYEKRQASIDEDLAVGHWSALPTGTALQGLVLTGHQCIDVGYQSTVSPASTEERHP